MAALLLWVKINSQKRTGPADTRKHRHAIEFVPLLLPTKETIKYPRGRCMSIDYVRNKL